jgi:NAD+ diphosphatase
VSGYIVPGERAEETMLREIKEETGLTVVDWKLEGTWWFARKEMMMIGFTAHVHDTDFQLSVEVDGASWHTAEEALTLVHQRPESVSRILTEIFLKGKR